MHEGGKIEVLPLAPVGDRDDLSMAYTPGVARVCNAIAAEPAPGPRAHHQAATPSPSSPTAPRCSAWATSAPRPRLPVMEGKALLFKEFAGVDAFPICLDVQRRRRDRRDGGAPGPRVRRHQPRGHRRAAVLRGRGAAQGPARHPGVPRRPARHRRGGAGRARERAQDRRQEDGRPQRRHRRRGRGRRGHLQDAAGGRRGPRGRHRPPGRHLGGSRPTSTRPSSGSPRTPTPTAVTGSLAPGAARRRRVHRRQRARA